jgi:hypothetical protein
MWQTSVLDRVIEGHLPSMATQGGTDALSTWDGGPVRWGHHLFAPEEWQVFVHAVEAGEVDVERLKRA